MAGLFPGWWVLAAATIGMGLGYSNIGVLSFGLFIVPLTTEFGWGRGEVSLAYTAMTYAMVFLAPLAGTLVDRLGVRRVLLPSIVLFALAIAGLSLVTASLLHLYVAYVLVAVLGAGTAPTTYTRAVVAWFNRRRGLAIGIAMAGVGLGGVLLPPLVQSLIAGFGWRTAYLALAAIVVVVSLPTAWAWLWESPAAFGLQPDADDQPSALAAGPPPGYEFRDAVRSRAFRLMAAGFALFGIFTAATITHLVPLLQDRGLTASQAALAASTMSLALVAGRLLSGVLLDRVPAPWVVVGFMSAPLAGLGLLLGGVAGSGAFGCAVLLGLGIGAEFDFMSYLVSRYMGLRAYGRMYGLMYSMFMLGSGIGPLVMGYSQQTLGSYDRGLQIVLIVTLIGIVPFALLGKYPVLPGAERPAPART